VRRLSNGEHVLTADDVAALGGQAGVYALRDALHNGAPVYAQTRYAPAAPLTIGSQSNSSPSAVEVTLVDGTTGSVLQLMDARARVVVDGVMHESDVRSAR